MASSTIVSRRLGLGNPSKITDQPITSTPPPPLYVVYNISANQLQAKNGSCLLANWVLDTFAATYIMNGSSFSQGDKKKKKRARLLVRVRKWSSSKGVSSEGSIINYRLCMPVGSLSSLNRDQPTPRNTYILNDAFGQHTGLYVVEPRTLLRRLQ